MEIVWRVWQAVLAIFTIGAVAAVVASPASAVVPGSAPSWGSMLLASFPLTEPVLASTTTTPGSVSPLLAKEMAVLTNQGISPARAMYAIEVQGHVAETEIVNKIEAAMGSAYAGVWFEPATAQLHIGVTSPESRRTAEGIIAQAGLEGDLTLSPVRSTWAQLVKSQKQWNRRLAKLFAREEVKTGLEPQHNAVSVTLSSSVPSPERLALKREAAAASVLVTVARGQLSFRPQAKTECKKWESNLAYCNASITSGVRIEGPRTERSKGKGKSHKTTTLDGFAEATLAKVFVGYTVEGPGLPAETRVIAKPSSTSVTINKAATKEEETEFTFAAGEVCTAGPLAVNVKKERVMLTAGHCIEAKGQKWSAINKAEKESVVGPAENFVNGGAKGAKIGDYGDVLIEPAWQTGKANDPVFADTAEWKKMNEKKEETSYPVTGERLPAGGNTNCHVGQTSGESCGEIKALNVTIVVGGVKGVGGKYVEGLVEDARKPGGEKLIGEGGDSGGPWLYINGLGEVFMEGTHDAGVPECVPAPGLKKGPQFFKTQAECSSSWEYKEEAGNEGEWERIATTTNLMYEPLKQPGQKLNGKGEPELPEGSLEALKLELLTTANEVIPPPCGG